MKLSKNLEDGLQSVSAVEVRQMIRSKLKNLIKDIEKLNVLIKNYVSWQNSPYNNIREWQKRRNEKLYELSEIERKLRVWQLKQKRK